MVGLDVSHAGLRRPDGLQRGKRRRVGDRERIGEERDARPFACALVFHDGLYGLNLLEERRIAPLFCRFVPIQRRDQIRWGTLLEADDERGLCHRCQRHHHQGYYYAITAYHPSSILRDKQAASCPARRLRSKSCTYDSLGAGKAPPCHWANKPQMDCAIAATSSGSTMQAAP